MTTTRVRIATLVASGVLMASFAAAQGRETTSVLADRFLDRESGLSLAQAISRAVAGEPWLRASRTDVDAARGRRLQAGLRPNPSVSIERREEPTGTDNLTTAQVQWPLDLFRRSARVAVADRELEAMERSVDERIRLLANDVRVRYGAAAAAVRELEVSDRAVERVSREFELVRQRADQGALPPLERDQMEVELHRYEADRLLSVGRAEASMIELKKTMGLAANSPLQLRDTLETLALPAIQETAAAEVSQTSAGLLERRTDVRSADADLRLAEARVERAATEGRVDVSLFGSYMRMDAGFPQNGLADAGLVERVHGVFHYVSAGATVTVPLRNRNEGETAAARAEQAGALARLDATRLAAQAEVVSAEARVTASRAAVTITSATVRLAARNLDVVRQAYELGRSTMTEVLAEQRRSLDIERAHIETMKAAYDAQTALMLARGER
ncbi:MAG: TolC family protein [Vicinamibacterales bacterium]